MSFKCYQSRFLDVWLATQLCTGQGKVQVRWRQVGWDYPAGHGHSVSQAFTSVWVCKKTHENFCPKSHEIFVALTNMRLRSLWTDFWLQVKKSHLILLLTLKVLPLELESERTKATMREWDGASVRLEWLIVVVGIFSTPAARCWRKTSAKRCREERISSGPRAFGHICFMWTSLF